MIVTCPGCGSKYRVRNDSVPQEGAKMKCPKCETMFLAKPPPLSAAGEPALDEPSSQFQSIAPQPPTGNNLAAPGPRPPTAPGFPQAPHGAPPAPHAAPAPQPSMKAGPVTALFGAFDAAMLPPEMQRPAPAPAPPAPASPSGLDVDVKPVVRQPPVTLNPPRPPTQTAHVPPPRRGPSARTEAIAWAAVGVSGALALFGVLVFAWTMEVLHLDGALLPVFAPFGAEAVTAGDDPALDDLRAQAKAAVESGDAGAGITLWSRVRARDPNDPLAKTEIPRLRSELGERQGT